MKKLLWIIFLVVIGYLAWRWWRGSAETATAGRGQELFYGRVWVDHLPSTPKEKFNGFGALKNHPFGWFAERSLWKGEWEVFRYEPRGDGQIELLFPHSNTKSRMSYRAWKCSDKKDFDYCLEVTGGRGPKKYYSRRGWERESLADARAFTERLAAPQP